MFCYILRKRTLVGVYGDPSWPYPIYEYQNKGKISLSNPPNIGDKIESSKIIDIQHLSNGTSIIIID